MSLFKILKDATNNAFALSKVVLGTVIDGAINGIAVFGFRDSSGNATMPQLSAAGQVPITFDIGTTIRDSAKLVGASQTKNTETEVLTLDLTLEKLYSKPVAQVDCFRASLFRFVYVDDYGVADTEKEIGYALVDAGNVHKKIFLDIDEFSTVGKTGVQKLVVFHTPLDKESDAYVSAAVNEI